MSDSGMPALPDERPRDRSTVADINSGAGKRTGLLWNRNEVRDIDITEPTCFTARTRTQPSKRGGKGDWTKLRGTGSSAASALILDPDARDLRRRDRNT